MPLDLTPGMIRAINDVATNSKWDTMTLDDLGLLLWTLLRYYVIRLGGN